ncbi:gamma-interferon-inducible lysosomal thiol reductase-like [Saccostrea cucullata]|uniref:gamma-interferon-inducible lysosomal thiol reductase-like n=1 Tax=Saccostrea cuccullata TaxID=36930 RepID=UPI002ED43B59
MLKQVVYFLFVVLAVSSANKCNVPPEFWCSSEEVATLCQVTEQCSHYYQSTGKADKVELTLYFESLCPDCKNFFRKQLTKTYNDIGEIINLTLVPYGNARETKDETGQWKFTCQHGEDECVGNLIETCAIHILKNISSYFPFISCIEHDQFGTPKLSANKCAKSQGIDLKPILECSTRKLGNSLEHEMALKTNALNPPHKYVPWVTLNGVHTEDIEKKAEADLTKLICDTYKGSPKPAACNKISDFHHSWREF